jgi:hypothetical protein
MTSEGIRLDLHPHSRFRSGPEGFLLLSGGALVRFPETPAHLYLPRGRTLKARLALCELSTVEEDGTLDVLNQSVSIQEEAGPRTQVEGFQRYFLDEGLRRPLPEAEAGVFLRRLAWFQAGPRRAQAPVIASQLAHQALRTLRGTERETAAKRCLQVAEEWVSRVARRYRDEAFARL